MKVVNRRELVGKIPIKTAISEHFTAESGKCFYSIEVTPKAGLKLDFNDMKTLPLFVDITWINDDNLKGKIIDSPALKLSRSIESAEVVNSIACNKLSDLQLDEFLSCSGDNLMVLRGDSHFASESQKFKTASELVTAIRARTLDRKNMTIFAAGYPETHKKAASSTEDILNLKKKIDSGVDIILSQVCFSAETFVDFVKRCRSVNISIPILPGLYIPRNLKELNFLLNLTKASIEAQVYGNLQRLEDDCEGFQQFSLEFTAQLVNDIKRKSPEHIPGFHFFSMNNFEMIQKLAQVIDFSHL